MYIVLSEHALYGVSRGIVKAALHAGLLGELKKLLFILVFLFGSSL